MLLLCVFVLPLASVGSKACVLNNYPYPLSKKGSLYYTVSPELNGYAIDSYVKSWNGIDGIKFVKVDDSVALLKNLNLEIYSSVDNDLNGSCYFINKENKNIIFFKAFTTLNSTNRAEVVVHEAGHALGLSHTQTYNNAFSIMRELNFNNKPYPQTDDILGIDAIYNK